MSTAWRKCIWREQCGSECRGRCEYWTPADTSKEDEAFYRSILTENAEEYQKIVREFADD